MERKGSLLLSILIICLWILCATIHQSLYIIFVILGLYYALSKSWHIKFNYVISSFLFLFSTLSIISILHLLVFKAFDFYNLKGLARFFSYLLLTILLIGFNVNTLRKSLKLILTYIAITLPWGIYNAINGERYYNIFEHPNHLGYVIVLLVVYLVYDFRNVKTPIFHLFILIVSLLLTKSSGAIGTTFIILLGIVFYKLKLPFLKKVLVFLIPIVVIIGVATFSEKVQGQIDDLNLISINYILERAEAHNAGNQGSFLWRLTYWTEILNAFAQEPTSIFILGKGADSLTLSNFPYDFMWTDAHNDFIKIFVEYGILGLISFIVFIGLLVKYCKMKQSLFLLLFVPMFFGNIIVNFPFIFTLILILTYFTKVDTSYDLNLKKV